MDAEYLKKYRFSVALGSLGSVAGLGYALYTGSGFWKGFGLLILGNIAGSATGYAIDVLTAPK